MLMLLRAWIGANDDAIASRLPENTSHCAAVSRLEPTPFCAPGDDHLEVAVAERVSAGSAAAPFTISPA